MRISGETLSINYSHTSVCGTCYALTLHRDALQQFVLLPCRETLAHRFLDAGPTFTRWPSVQKAVGWRLLIASCLVNMPNNKWTDCPGLVQRTATCRTCITRDRSPNRNIRISSCCFHAVIKAISSNLRGFCVAEKHENALWLSTNNILGYFMLFWNCILFYDLHDKQWYFSQISLFLRQELWHLTLLYKNNCKPELVMVHSYNNYSSIIMKLYY